MIAALPGGWRYFSTWRTLRWFLALSLPPIGSAVAVWMHGHGFWQAAGVWLFGFVISIPLFVSLCSGMSSSNKGTYFRRTEPERYWVEIALMVAVYIAVCCVGYFWR
jgi:hypothetical protein